MTRLCEGCGAILARSAKTSDRDWLAKRFCTRGCRIASGHAFIGEPGGSYDFNPSKISDSTRNLGIAVMALFERTAQARRVSIEEAARMHLCPPRVA